MRLAIVLFVLAAGAVQAAEPTPPPVPSPPSSAAAAAQPAMPDAFKLSILIRTTLIALSQANATGNYSVLRDLGAPGFREGNDSAKLAEIFADLRRRKLDLRPLVFFDPKLRQPAQLDTAGMVRLTGFFETRPEQVEFELIFQLVAGDWKLFGIAVGTRRSDATASASADAAPAQPQPAPAVKPPEAKPPQPAAAVPATTATKPAAVVPKPAATNPKPAAVAVKPAGAR